VIFLLLCFIFSNLFLSDLSLVFASEAPANKITLSQPFKIDKVQIPKAIGEIRNRSTGSGNRQKTVILIQDAHAIPEAQENIEKIIHFFHDTYGFKLVGLEGADAALDPHILSSFPDQAALDATLADFYKQAEMPGGLAAAIRAQANGKLMIFHGVENWNLFEEGLSLYSEAVGREKDLKKILNVVHEKIESEKKKLYPKKFLEIDESIERFYSNQEDLLKTLTILAQVKAPESGSSLSLLLEELKKDEKGETTIEPEIKAALAQIQAYLKAHHDSKRVIQLASQKNRTT